MVTPSLLSYYGIELKSLGRDYISGYALIIDGGSFGGFIYPVEI